MKLFSISIVCWASSLVAAFTQGLDAQTVPELIEQLVEVDSPDTGYAQFFSGSNFLPYQDAEQLGTMIIGATGRKRSLTLQKLVELGFESVPELLKHLDDQRKVNLPPIESGGMMWISFDNAALLRAKEVLNGLPPDTTDGKQLLHLILEKSPDEAEVVLLEFLQPNTPSRCNTVCELVWYGNPLSQKILLPMLDKERPIPDFSVNVRDRAATAISHSIESIQFDSDWPKEKREATIQKIKEFCEAK